MTGIVRYPQTIAAEINSIKGQTKSIVLLASAEIGKRLVEAKELLPHGEWGGWLANNIDYSQSTANNLMQLYNEYGTDLSTIPALGNLSYTKAIALIGIDSDEREQFIEDNDVENMSAKELQKVIKEKQTLEKELKKREKAADTERKKLTKEIEGLHKQLSEAESNGADVEDTEQLRSDLETSNSKIKQLEKDLKAKPIEAAAVEVIPDEIEAELASLRSKLAEQGDPTELKFKLRFESLVAEFRNTLDALNGISDEDNREKFKGAVSGLITKMGDSL